MPNHVTNIVTAPKEVLDFMRGEPNEQGEIPLFDFNKVIPMPEGLMEAVAESRAVSLGALLSGGVKLSPSLPEDPSPPNAAEILENMKTVSALGLLDGGGIKAFPDEKGFENFLLVLRNIYRYGHATWYEWALENWGTKWNAYSFKEMDGAVQFDTAWSAPHDIVKKLAELFPYAKIVHRWADEDVGSNCGCRVYEDNAVQDIEQADPVDFALMILGYGREDYWENPETGKWEYHPEEEDE